MAQSFWVDTQGRIYQSAAAANSTSDQQLAVLASAVAPSVAPIVSAAGLTAIPAAASPATKQSVDDSLFRTALATGTWDSPGGIVRMH